jgi:hypothetical protein
MGQAGRTGSGNCSRMKFTSGMWARPGAGAAGTGGLSSMVFIFLEASDFVICVWTIRVTARG